MPKANSQLRGLVRVQEVAVAKFEKRSITLTGSLEDLKGMTPVQIDSQNIAPAPDSTSHLLNPALDPSRGAAEAGPARVKAQIGTAYDESNLYLIAAVSEDQFHCSAGQSAKAGQGEGDHPSLSARDA